MRGDANLDGNANLSDAVFILGCAFLGTECTTCDDAADVNDDAKLDITDPIYLLNFLFLGGPALPPPVGECGEDPTEDALGCASFPACTPLDPDAIETSRGPLLVRPVEHASLGLLWDGKKILVDPVGSASRYADFSPADLIVVTHTHNDHLAPAVLRSVAGPGTVLVVPQSVATSLAGSGGAGDAEMRILANGEATTVGDIRVEAVAMYNLTADRLQYHPKGVGNSYVLDLDGTRVYVSGDTEDIPEMRALTDIACAFLCMNLPFTMTPDQAASAALEFQPRVVYPYHYRGQDTARFQSLVEEGSGEIEVRLRSWYP